MQTETIPAPENILTSSLPNVFNPVLDISPSIETLPAVVLASSTGIDFSTLSTKVSFYTFCRVMETVSQFFDDALTSSLIAQA